MGNRARKNHIQVAAVDRVDEEGGKALLHLSQSCQRRATISINSDGSSSEFGTVKTESLSDEPVTMNHQSTDLGAIRNHNGPYTTKSYPAYTEKPIRTTGNTHLNNNNVNTRTRDIFKVKPHHNGHAAVDSGYGGDLSLPADSPEILNYNLHQQHHHHYHHHFELEAPSISTTDVGYLYEISTRLLFVTIEWVQSLDAFQKLAKKDQYNLLLNKWHSLFVLGMAQSSSMFPISTMLFLANVNNDKRGSNDHQNHDNDKGSEATTTTTSPATPLPWSTFVKLKDVVLNGAFTAVRGELSKTTYDYMKMVTLFDTGTI